ncbi:hypothetical protein [Halofilum ochraceum]|uniref:hypothetical protein n=1 Tax=Halofilum ochraceum TaxID=1611323 RepID=UPI0008D9B9EA|nr:hypothetical protein [Halofilum ochraceum]
MSSDREETLYRRAIPIETVRGYVEQQMGEAEADYERAFPSELRVIDPDAPQISPTTCEQIRNRYKWLSYVVVDALGWAEDEDVGAVLARDLDHTLLEQLCLLREQLYWQEWVDTVPRVLTEFAVEPFLRDTPGPGPGQISADFGVWCRQQIGKRKRGET